MTTLGHIPKCPVNSRSNLQCSSQTATRLCPLSPSATLLHRSVKHRRYHPRRSNPHSARGTAVRSPSAVSSLGGFRTPAASARRTLRRGRHPKPFTLTVFRLLVRFEQRQFPQKCRNLPCRSAFSSPIWRSEIVRERMMFTSAECRARAEQKDRSETDFNLSRPEISKCDPRVAFTT